MTRKYVYICIFNKYHQYSKDNIRDTLEFLDADILCLIYILVFSLLPLRVTDNVLRSF